MNVIRNLLYSHISQLRGLEFNKLLDGIFSIVYKTGYTPIKQKQDRGSDGIIEPEKISIAAYAPEKYNKREFEKKVDEDYEKFCRNYKPLNYKWRFITNHEIRGNMEIYIKSKDTTNEIWGIDQLINFILDQPPHIRRQILRDVFAFPPELIKFQFIEEIVEEIVKISKSITYKNLIHSYKIPLDTFKKIEINFSGEDVEIMKKKFQNFYSEHVPYLQKVLSSYDDDFISHLKNTVLYEYMKLSDERMSFKDKFFELIKRFSIKYPKDEAYRNYVELVILYLFEQCLIGRDPGGA